MDEKSALNVKQAALVSFWTSIEFMAMCRVDRELLVRQADLMQEYSDVLGARIARF